MARSRYIYVVHRPQTLHGLGVEVVAAFTVKYECVGWLTRRRDLAQIGDTLAGLEVVRVDDGGGGRTRLGTAAEFLAANGE